MCKKLANLFLLYSSSRCLVLDDEKYSNYDGSNMQGNDNYYYIPIITLTTTQMTNRNDNVLEKRNIRTNKLFG